MNGRYLEETAMLDFSSPSLMSLVEERGWGELSEVERVRSIYLFVRDEILFGYNTDDSIPASKVLSDGYGQCNTKGTLFMALLRASGIPSRIHGFTIDKRLQKGAMTGLVYLLAPRVSSTAGSRYSSAGCGTSLRPSFSTGPTLKSFRESSPHATARSAATASLSGISGIL